LTRRAARCRSLLWRSGCSASASRNPGGEHRGFVEPIARELPMEYALELNRLIGLQMEGAVG
jgi:hypothetical protein